MIIDCQGEHLELLADRALFWIRTKTLLVADPHFGKASVFRSHGIPIPNGTTKINLDRLDALLHSTSAERLFFLGDFLHGPIASEASFLTALAAWRAKREGLSIRLLIGNHDRAAAPLAHPLRMHVSEELVEGPFVFKHHPEPDPRGYVICGHIHPAMELTDVNGTPLRLRCFWFQQRLAVLPSFGEFTGSYYIEPSVGDTIFGVGQGHVLTLLKGLNARQVNESGRA